MIRENLGHVTFVKDVVTVKLSLKELNSFTEVLKGTKEQIDTLLRHPAKDKVWNTTLDLLKTQNEKLSHIVPSRRKRSLFSWGGDVLHAVFGTATEGEVRSVKEKMKLIEKWANLKGKVIQSTVKRLNAQSSRIVELDQNLAHLAEVFFKGSQSIDAVKLNTYFLSVTELLSYLIDQYEVIQDAITLARNNIIIPNLLAPEDLAKVLKDAKDKYGFKLLYGSKIRKYYSVLRAKSVGDTVFVFIPFAASTELKIYRLVPFPTLINETVAVELDVKEVIVLFTSNFDLLAITDQASIKDYCISVASNHYLCSANKLHFFPATQFSCLLKIAVHLDIDDSCKFKKVPQQNLAIRHVTPYNYIFSRQSIAITLDCGGKEPELRQIVGNVKIHEDCGVFSPNVVKIFPSNSQVLSTLPYVPLYQRHILRELDFPESHQEVVVRSMTTPVPLPEDSWMDGFPETFEDLHPYMTFIGTPLFILLVVIGFCIVARVFYAKKYQQWVRRIKVINENLKARSTEVPEAATAAASSES